MGAGQGGQVGRTPLWPSLPLCLHRSWHQERMREVLPFQNQGCRNSTHHRSRALLLTGRALESADGTQASIHCLAPLEDGLGTHEMDPCSPRAPQRGVRVSGRHGEDHALADTPPHAWLEAAHMPRARASTGETGTVPRQEGAGSGVVRLPPALSVGSGLARPPPAPSPGLGTWHAMDPGAQLLNAWLASGAPSHQVPGEAKAPKSSRGCSLTQ
nr:uncharacterized protein LOC129474395 [Symphalangus syndactylus]